jgi:hypothetical protein
LAVDDADGVADDDVAALAIAPPLTAAAATAAAVTSLDLMPCIQSSLGWVRMQDEPPGRR